MSDDTEVVTDAKLRFVRVPGLAGEVALVTLDNGGDHTRPNTFGPEGLARLDAALDAVAARPGVAAIAVTGKPFGFAAGADLTGVPRVRTREQALEIGRVGHRTFRRLHDSAVATFAFVNGTALGGGLETALHCHYRTISSGAAPVGLPECFLGLVPGWGGTQLLPRLVGVERALRVIVENPLELNRTLTGRQAFELGIADAMFEPADFLERSLEWLADVVTGAARVARPPVDTSVETWDAAVARVRAAVDARLHGAAPAPYRALELVALARTADLDAGFAAEDEALADLLLTPELRAGLYAFELTRTRAKRPVGVPDVPARPVGKVGIVGAGLMASQLALLFVRRLEVPVVLTDVEQQRVDQGVAWVHGQIDGLLAKDRIDAGRAAKLRGLVTGSLSKAAFADADFVVEAVFEEPKVKQQVFAECEAVVADTCVLATNTSSLSVTTMAAALRHPARVVGFHFFNPVAVLPLVEVVRAERTDATTLATAFAVAGGLRKSAVLVADAPAFVVNRLLTRFLGEVFAAVDTGTPFPEADRALEPLGLPMAPSDLLALVGPAVALHVTETLHEAFPDRFRVSDNLRRLVAARKPGVWTWTADGKVFDPEVAALLQVPDGAVARTAEQVREASLRALAEEIRLLLDEGVVSSPQDVDLCLLLGAGWPFHLGGITPYLDRTGVSQAVTGSRFLPPGVADPG